ncbi:acid sphingomyelinase-like phosphodiesterase 3b [Dromiciops gliroides]|uniref:acid sphingomyelinase-like phosphodiesterase 3b n=1 Tax=Dromiciops gliroides TaxID=33562 RepID=UPI001CC6C47D|nr:acid sphingomyelinase-like phosphodiesterase 3b [Dromiciops gliroides]
MRWLKLLLFLLCWRVTGAIPGQFWHISDLHLDPDYKASQDPLQVCPSAGSQPVPNAGVWGNYLCDAPWILINSSIYAMKAILPSPDFILWTGDDTPHVPNEKLGEEAVLEIVKRLTDLIQSVFPETKVYSALGNHDFHPKSQLPAGSNNIYDKVAELWRPWLNNESVSQFKEGAFYTERLPSPDKPGRIVVLNSNLYYSNNKLTANLDDPGSQFQWLEDVLSNASREGEKVYVIGHVPPGFFEKTRSKAWFRPNFNQRYMEIIKKYHHVIAGQFFGHQHTDSFRMFYDDTGVPISVMFLAPAVSPWKTTLSGVSNGANNPGIRVWEYDRATFQLQDMVTYYLNLTHANLQAPRWEKEYRLTEAFQALDGSAASMQRVLDQLTQDNCALQRYYRYNSVSYDLDPCEQGCRAEQLCALREVDFAGYERCINSSCGLSGSLLLLCLMMGLHLIRVLAPR